MSTGIPSSNHTDHKIQVLLSYHGKKDQNDILLTEYPDFRAVNNVTQNHFFFADNRDALLYLLHHGYSRKVQLVYIDPPFATLANFVSRRQTQAYSDCLTGGHYVEFLRERLIILHELLAEDGSIYLHLDMNMAFTMKLIMDEIFGEKNLRAFITRRKCSTKNYTKNTYGNISDYIMFYSKGPKYVWNRPFASWTDEKIAQQYPHVDALTGRRYKKVPLHAPGIRNGETGKEWRGKPPPPGKHWQFTPQKLEELDANGEICWSANGNPRRKVFCETDKGIPVQDIWLDFRDSINQAQMTTGYPTEKNLDMLKMIVEASSKPGALVLDCFAGSGTTLAAAAQCGRRWIGIDNSTESCRAILKRFTDGLDSYGDYVHHPSSLSQSSTTPSLASCPFTFWTPSDSSHDFSSLLSPPRTTQ